VITIYAFIVLSEWRAGLTDVALKREVLRWLVLSTVLAYLSVMAGYIARLRREAGEHRMQLINAMQEVQRLAAHDELTGIPNRRGVDDAVAAERERAERYASTFSVCVMDLDFFKRVNDSFGHAAGDTVLKTLVRFVHASLRPTDLIGRYGGEEFVLLLPQTPLAGAVTVAERIRMLCSELQFEGVLHATRVTVSIGVAEHIKGQSWERTIERADHALYRAKQQGRNQVQTAT
jgi:diguanylate cyclase (GGDEF)-like protein